MRLNEILHLLQGDTIRHSFLLEEAKLISRLFFLIRHLAARSARAARVLALLQAVLHVVQPAEHIRLDRPDLEEHGQALAEVVL